MFSKGFSDAVEKAIADYQMLREGDSVIVALSGGADSVSLLNYLISVKKKYKLDIYAAHLNHNLRGAEAKRDEDFVCELCEKAGVKLFVKSVDIGALAEERKISAEMCGREERYEFFEALCKKYKAKVATAHTASDNAETVLYNLSRGSGLSGLCGIPPVRGAIIRPLIYVTREQVESYCKENHLDFVTDSTNLTDEYTRNRIRHNIIPSFRELSPSFESSVTRTTTVLRSVNSFLELKINEIIESSLTEEGYSLSVLREIPENSLGSVMVAVLKREKIEEFDSVTVGLLMKCVREGGAVHLHGDRQAVCKQGTLRFVDKIKSVSDFETPFTPTAEFTFDGYKYFVKEIKQVNSEDILSSSIIDKNPIFRTRRRGDRFTLPRRNVTKSLKKLFNELKIPAEKRDSLLLLAADSEVLWIDGIGVSAKAKAWDGDGFLIEKAKISNT